MIVRNGIVAGGDGAAAPEERRLHTGAVIRKSSTLCVNKIFLPTLDGRLDVAHRSAAFAGVVEHRAARDDIVAAARRVAQHVLHTARAHDLARIVVHDRVADHDCLVPTDRGACAAVSDQRKQFAIGIEGDGAPLKTRHRVSRLRQQ